MIEINNNNKIGSELSWSPSQQRKQENRISNFQLQMSYLLRPRKTLYPEKLEMVPWDTYFPFKWLSPQPISHQSDDRSYTSQSGLPKCVHFVLPLNHQCLIWNVLKILRDLYRLSEPAPILRNVEYYELEGSEVCKVVPCSKREEKEWVWYR